MVSEDNYRIKLSIYEGPLDLLLFLVRKNELDIYDIPIESIMRQYLEILYAMKKFQLETAGNFFVMAATLMEIKSRMLLPKHKQTADISGDEEELGSCWEFVHHLIQYKKFKEAAQNLGRMAYNAQNMLSRSAPSFIPISDRPLKHVDRIELWNKFNLVLRRLSEKLRGGEIHAEQVTVANQMEYVLQCASTHREFTFSSLFEHEVALRRLITTFLAVLELTRLKKLSLRQDTAFAEIYCASIGEGKPLVAASEAPTLTV